MFFAFSLHTSEIVAQMKLAAIPKSSTSAISCFWSILKMLYFDFDRKKIWWLHYFLLDIVPALLCKLHHFSITQQFIALFPSQVPIMF